MGVCQMVKLAGRIGSGRVPLACRNSSRAHKMTEKGLCVSVCEVYESAKKWRNMKQGQFYILHLCNLFPTCIYESERELSEESCHGSYFYNRIFVW